MILEHIAPIESGIPPLSLLDWPVPEPASDEVLIRVSACGVCHTELDEIEGRTPPPRLPIILGHQAVGHIEKLGQDAGTLTIGQRVGVAWIHSACGVCRYCMNGLENLCPGFKGTGRDVHGGYAEFMTAKAAFIHPLPDFFSDAEAAPLLCAGAVGFRALRLTGLQDGQSLGFMGFGASAHLVLQLARHLYPCSRFFVFARNVQERDFARSLGAFWAGDTADAAPERLHAIIDTTPAWLPDLKALQSLAPGGRLVINAIRKEMDDRDNLLALDYSRHLWMEKEVKTVANVTRNDVWAFLQLAAEAKLKPEVEVYGLENANEVLQKIKQGQIRGAKVLQIG